MTRKLPTPIETFKLKANSFALQFPYLSAQERRDQVHQLLQNITALDTVNTVEYGTISEDAVNDMQVSAYHMSLDDSLSMIKTHKALINLSNML